jgi:NAD(P)H-flavin reductase
MMRLQRTFPWLSVHPVTEEQGRLPEAVCRYGPWSERDAYLSGPLGMVRRGVDALRGAGIPVERIRHDFLAELAPAKASDQPRSGACIARTPSMLPSR